MYGPANLKTVLRINHTIEHQPILKLGIVKIGKKNVKVGDLNSMTLGFGCD